MSIIQYIIQERHKIVKLVYFVKNQNFPAGEGFSPSRLVIFTKALSPLRLENGFKKGGKRMKKLIAVLLCVLMAFGSLPQTIAMAAGFPTGTTPGTAKTVGGYNKVVDTATVNGWEDYFSQSPLTTENAGGVWSDKSVFNQALDLKNAEGVTNQANAAYNNMKVGPDNFLVALSAIAANKEIVGYSTIPTDTMFILDVSQSMDNSQSIPTMVSAVNSAMHTLLSLNNHNRVGLVLYSGNDNTNEKANLGDATVLLPIARYTPVLMAIRPDI